MKDVISWSARARRLADIKFNEWKYYNENPSESYEVTKDYVSGDTCIANTADKRLYESFFSNSYRHPLIKMRAAKRFGRLVRKYSSAGKEE